MDYYINKYITQLNNLNLPEHKQYELLCALENNHILWDDIPPDFCDKFDIPYAMDYGVDTINLEYTQSGQAKHYNNNSLITWSAMTNFRCYSSDVLEIDNMLLFTNVDSKIDKLVQKKLIDTNIIKLVRKNYSDLLKKWSNVPVVIPDIIEVKEILSFFFSPTLYLVAESLDEGLNFLGIDFLDLFFILGIHNLIILVAFSLFFKGFII